MPYIIPELLNDSAWRDISAPVRVFGGAEVVNVRDPVNGGGAKGDGITDDTQAIQAAAASVPSGGTLFFPAGFYLASQTITVSSPSVTVVGVGSDQVASAPGGVPRAGSILFANANMTDLLKFTSSVALQGGHALYEMFVDGNGKASNTITVDASNVQIQNCDIRRAATNGAMINITANGASAWLSNIRCNGSNQAGTTGVLVNGTDLTAMAVKCVNCVYSVQLLTGASGAILQSGHHTPGSTIGASCFYVNGHPSHIQIIGNRIDNHALGSGIQLSPDANLQAVVIADNLFAQSVLTDNTFAAIGVDTSAGSCYGLKVTGNLIRNISGTNRYASLLTSQTLAGAAATNPTRMASQGTLVASNTVHAPVLFGTSSNPLAARGNVLTTDGTTFTAPADI